jgi:hypothetical protein
MRAFFLYYSPIMYVCFIGIDSPNQTEYIYAQVLRDELGYGGTVTRFNPLPTEANTRQDLMDFMRCRPEKMFIVIGSAELAMRKFIVFYKFMEAFQVVSKEGLKALLEFEMRIRKPSSPYSKSRPPSAPLASEPQSLSTTQDSTKKLETTDPRR